MHAEMAKKRDAEGRLFFSFHTDNPNGKLLPLDTIRSWVAQAATQQKKPIASGQVDLHQRRQQHVTHPDVALQRAYSRSQRRAVSRAVAQRGPGAASQAWLRQRECRELCTMWSKKLRPAASEASQPPSVVRTARQAAQTRPAASPRHRTALSHAWNVPAEASAARAAGHMSACVGDADDVA
jgi:hypothetical protein